jgi:hypothetical protein
MTLKPEPVNPMNRFNARYGSIKKKTTAEQPAPTEPKAEGNPPKDTSNKKHRITNDLSELAEILEEAKNETDTPKAKVVEKTKEEKGEETMDNQKITQEMREGLNALGMDDETINGLSYDVASDILRDKDEISKKLDNITDNQKITQEMREGLNALGMDDETINALKFNEALGILRDKDEISKKLDELSIAANKKPEEIIVHEQDTPPQPTPAEHTDMHWIDEKIRDYTEMKTAGNTAIKEFNGDKTAGTFTAEIDNGTVTYTSPNDVSVTKDSSYKVFDTMMKEPSNAGKAVRLPEDATAEFRTNLFVAAVLNGHKVNGAEGLELDEATLAKIGLTPEQKAQVLAALPKQEEKAPAEKTTQEKPAEEKPSEKVAEAITKLEDTQAKLAELVKDGKVSATISSNTETKRSEIVFNFDASKGGNQANADEANKLFTEALKSIDELRQKTLPADETLRKQAVVDNYAIKSAQLGLIRSVYQPEPSEAVKAMDRVRAKKLGLETGEVKNKNGDTVKTLEGDALNNYQSKMSANILSRIKAGHEGK